MKIFFFLQIFLLFAVLINAETKNPDQPLKGEWEFSPKIVLELSGVNDQVFATPNFVVSDDGTIYINDFKNKSSFIFDSTGQFIKAFAPSGEGPGEIRVHLASFLANDKIVVCDFGRLHFFSHKGEFLKFLLYSTDKDFPCFFINENEYIATTENIFVIGSQFWHDKGQIHHHFINTGQKKTIAEYSFQDKPTAIPGGQPMRLTSLHSSMIVGYDPENQRIYYGMNDSYIIYVADINSGKIVNTFSISRSREKIKKEKIADIFKQLHIIGPTSADVHRFPDSLVYFSRILIDDGLVFVLNSNFGIYTEKQNIDIFSLDGRYIYKACFNPGKDSQIYFPMVLNNILIKKGHLYAVVENNAGEVFLKKYKISIPKL